MNELKSAVSALCILGAGAYLCQLILGGTKLNRQVSLLITMFMAATLLGFFGKGLESFEIPEIPPLALEGNDCASEMYRHELENESAGNICKVLMAQLNAAGIEPEKIEADVNISPDGSISITKVRLTGCGEEGAELVRKSLGCEREVVEIVGDT